MQGGKKDRMTWGIFFKDCRSVCPSFLCSPAVNHYPEKSILLSFLWWNNIHKLPACSDAAILSLPLLLVPDYFTHIPAKCCPRPQTTIHHTTDICCSSIAMHWMATARQPSSGNVIATSVEQDARRAKPLFMRRSVDTFSCNISASTTDVIGDQTAANFGMTLFLLLLSYNICISCSCWTECSSRPL